MPDTILLLISKCMLTTKFKPTKLRLRRWQCTHLVFNIDAGLRLYQYVGHFSVAILGRPVKRCITILWGKTFFKSMKALVTIITYVILVIYVCTMIDQ